MPVFLTCLSVIMLFRPVMSKEDIVQDITERCINKRLVSIYLTSGVGISDASVVMAASDGNLECLVEYTTTSAAFIMVVVQFPDWTPKTFCNDNNTVFMVSQSGIVDQCIAGHLKPISFMVSDVQMSVLIQSNGSLGTVSVTSTSLRDPKTARCRKGKEIECIVDKKAFCMTSSVMCDGYANCGRPGLFDEDKRTCGDVKLTPEMIIASIVMSIISFWLVVSVVMAILPKRKETFIYKFDKTIALFDSRGDHVHVDINVQVVFPQEPRSRLHRMSVNPSRFSVSYSRMT